MNKTHEVSIAAAVRQRVLRASNTAFTADDFRISRKAVQRELSRLVAAGELRHVRNGVYWRGRNTALGMTPPRGEEIVRKIVGEGVGPAEWSASLELGLSTQHPNKEIVASPRRIRGALPSVRVKDRTSREGRRSEKLNRYEIALLEVLDDWGRVVEVPTHVAVKRLSQWLDTDRVSIRKLVKASKTEPARVRQNLRELLMESGYPEEASKVKEGTSNNPRHSLIAAA